MSSTRLLVAMVMFCLSGLSPAFGLDAENDIRTSVENFFREYVQVVEKHEPRANWLKRNPDLTENFKHAYLNHLGKFKKEGSLSTDPILGAQDLPEAPFKVVKIQQADDHATVEVETSDWPDHVIRIRLIKVGAKWFIDSINKINQ